MTSPAVPSTPLRVHPHLLRLPSTPRTAALVEIRSRHALQTSTSLTISHFATLLAELNASSELDHRIGFEQDRLDKIETFRQDFMTGILMRVKPLELLGEGESETFSDGRRTSLGGTTTASSSQETDDPDPSPSSSRGTAAARIFQMPLDAISRGVIAEKTIKDQLRADRVLLSHDDYSSIARVARKAIKKTLRLKKPIYVSPGLLHSVDWTNEYKTRGWAPPGIRWGPFKPDLIKFERVQRKNEDEEVEGQVEVSWEIVEVKYASKTRDVIYTNYKVQAIYYHLTLQRLLSAVPSLVPSHKVTFFVSHDPLSPQYLEKPLSVRTTQAFVEHHLFVLLPEWLRAVKDTEWKRLQDKLAEKAQVSASGSSSSTPTFLEKLQASQRKPPPSAFQPRAVRTVPSTPLAKSHSAASCPRRKTSSSPPLVSSSETSFVKTGLVGGKPLDELGDSDEEEDDDESFRSAPSSPTAPSPTSNPNKRSTQAVPTLGSSPSRSSSTTSNARKELEGMVDRLEIV